MNQREGLGAVTYMWLCRERRGLAVACLDLEIERQLWLKDNVDGGLLTKYKMRRVTKINKKQEQKTCYPHNDGMKISLILTKKTDCSTSPCH